MTRTSLVLLILLLLASVVEAQKTSPGSLRPSKQTQFGAEEDIRRPVKIPKAVLQMLRRDERVEQCFQNDPKLGNDIASWFKASAVDLNNDRHPDLVVKPENACLFGANIIPFWIYRNMGKRYELVLKTHTLSMNILRSRTNGYRDVEVNAASATMLFGADYKFDGKKYVPRRCWQQSIEDLQKGRTRVTYVKCSADIEKPYRD